MLVHTKPVISYSSVQILEAPHTRWRLKAVGCSGEQTKNKLAKLKCFSSNSTYLFVFLLDLKFKSVQVHSFSVLQRHEFVKKFK